KSDADQVGLPEVVAAELVDLAHRIEVLGARAPRPAVDADVRDASRERAVDELCGEGLPAIDLRVVETAALEARLAGADRAHVRLIEAALAEDAPPPGREQRLESAV